MYRIGICDDDEAFCWQTEEYIRAYCERHNLPIDSQIFLSGEELLKYTNSIEQPFDLLLLDIEMEGMDGVAVGLKLRESLANEVTQLVYISCKSSYAMRLFKTRPLDFLIKPVTKDSIEHMMDNYCYLYVQNNNYFEYKNGKNIIRVDQKHILYLQSEGKIIHIYTLHGSGSFYGKLSDTLLTLDSNIFYSVHKSFVINWNHIAEYKVDTIILSDGSYIPVSQSRRNSVKERILKGLK